MSHEPFTLANDPPAPGKTQFDDNARRQRVLLSGLDCLPGQLDLFHTDGEKPMPATSPNWRYVIRGPGAYVLDGDRTVCTASVDDARLIAEAPAMLRLLNQLTDELERGREWISADTLDWAVGILQRVKG